MQADGLAQLLLQSLEHERNAVDVYQAALRCVVNDALREEWEQYLAETRSHIDVLSELCEAFQVDPEAETVGRTAVRAIGSAILAAIERALAEGDRNAAQLVACECVMLLESKDHLNWALLDAKIRKAFRAPLSALKLACEQMEGEEDEHLYHARSWTRILWKERLGAVTQPMANGEDGPALARSRSARY